MGFAVGSPERELAAIEAQEAELGLPRFTADDAWRLGNLLRMHVAQHANAAVINIALAHGEHLLFHSATRAGTAPDNDVWVARKRKTVLRWGHSSWWMHVKMGGNEAAFAAKYALGGEAGSFAMHGGVVPTRVDGVEGVVGVAVVSGLKQEEDHMVVVEALRALKAEILKQ